MLARMLATDWLQAQRKLQSLIVIARSDRIARSTDPNPQAIQMRGTAVPWDALMQHQWALAVFTQRRECERCGHMLIVNFDAANDDRCDSPGVA